MKKYHHCVKFTYPLPFQTRIPKVDQHTGGKWLIHGTKHRKDNQLQSLELWEGILLTPHAVHSSQINLYDKINDWNHILIFKDIRFTENMASRKWVTSQRTETNYIHCEVDACKYKHQISLPLWRHSNNFDICINIGSTLGEVYSNCCDVYRDVLWEHFGNLWFAISKLPVRFIQSKNLSK